ncbi:uncharacterized protein KIAA0825 isoform X2 [Centruroides vittatus]|uniref:uncharacterized protein KIAA0825 isoform X2 n=1 Tax=Centruroides vittatus TaxID=120091 RepID=UPI0035105E10
MASNTFLSSKEGENDKIEKCLKEIESYLKKLECKQEKKTAKISPNNVRGKVPLHELLEEMRNTLQEYGLEELLIPHLEELKKQNDLPHLVSIGKKYDEYDLQNVSEEMKTNILWEMISFHIMTYIKKKLIIIHKNHHLSQYNTFNKYLICYYLRNLSELIMVTRMWELHQNIRINILEELKCLCPSKTKEVCLQCLLITSTDFILEDKELICNGYFQPLVVTWTEITKIYIQFIAEKYTKLLENISQMRKMNENDWLSSLSMQCFLKMQPSCQLKYENKFLMSTKRIHPIVVKNISNKDLEEYHKSNFSNKNINICYLLLRIIKMMHNFEEKILSICIDGSYKTRIICNHSSASECTSQGIPLMVPNDSPEQSPIHIQLSDNNESLPFNWNWRYIFQDFGFLTFIQRCLQDQMQNHIQFCLTKEWKLISWYKRLPSVTVESGLQRNKKILIFSIACVIEELDKFSPLLSSCQGVFLPFHATFNHVLHTYVIELLSHVERISSAIPQKLSLENLYVLLASTAFLKERLLLYTQEMNYIKEENKNNTLTVTLQDKISKLEDLLLQKVLNYQIKLLVSGILQDADSHNWSFHKPFFEGNRISFSVQMWNLHLNSILNDVKQYLPSKLAQRIILKILYESLNHFVSRYAKAAPSKARINQFRNDIITILLCTTEFLPYVCLSESQHMGKLSCPFDNESNVSIIDSIHNYCYMLLTIMTIVTSPLPTLYKIIKKGIPSSYKQMNYLPWLSCIQPAVYAYIGQGKLISSSSVWLNVKLSISQMELEPYLVIKAFLNHECTLAILFMTQANEETVSYERDGLSSPLKNSNDSKLRLSRALFSILQFCYHQPDSLANVLLPVIQSTLISSLPMIIENNKMKLFNVPKSKWMELSKTMSYHLECDSENVLYQVDENKVEIECALHILSSFKEQLISLPLTVIKCISILEMQFLQSKQNFMPIYNSLLIQLFLSALNIVLTELKYLEELIEAYNLDLCHDIIDKTFNKLLDLLSDNNSNVHIDKQYTYFITDFRDHINVFFERSSEKNNLAVNNSIQEFEDDCLEITVTEYLQSKNGKEHIHYLYNLLKTNLLWIQTSLGIPDITNTDSVLNSISPSPYQLEECKNVKVSKKLNKTFKSAQSIEELISDKCPSTASQLPGAVIEDCLNNVQHVLYTCVDTKNYELYEKHIIDHLKELSSSKVVDKKIRIKLDSNFVSSDSPFNPFLYFNSIGNSTNTLNQETYKEFTISWELLLDHIPMSDLSEEGLKTLLMHRWEFIGKDPLPSGQEKYVHLLKLQYGLEDEDGDDNQEGESSH